MWYAYDIFTGERFGPFPSQIAALVAPELDGLTVSVRYVSSRKRKS